MNEIKYEKVGRRDINLFSINYKIFQDICGGNKPVARNYPPSRILPNRRHTICCACNHIWLTEEDYNSFWSEFDQAWKSDQFDYIYVDISDLQDGVIMVAKFVDKKSDYCVLREWAVAGTVGPDSRLREKKLREKLRTVLSEQKLVAWVAFF